jgi:hypothetical protein
VDLTPVVRQGRWLTLEPLDERHAAGVFEAMQDEEVCRYLAWAPPKALDQTCFETLGCLRVALKTDACNVRSQEATVEAPSMS